jgi:hypothetical protein
MKDKVLHMAIDNAVLPNAANPTLVGIKITHTDGAEIRAYHVGQTLVLEITTKEGGVVVWTQDAGAIRSIADAARMAGGSYAGQVAHRGKSSGKVVDGKRKRGKRG